jgi:hypothetical protein
MKLAEPDRIGNDMMQTHQVMRIEYVVTHYPQLMTVFTQE